MASKADAFRKKAEEYRDLAQSATKPYAIGSMAEDGFEFWLEMAAAEEAATDRQ